MMYNGYVPLATMAKVTGTVVGKWISHGMPSGIFHFSEIAYSLLSQWSII
jgi:hypothetical protein